VNEIFIFTVVRKNVSFATFWKGLLLVITMILS